jgi:hypothetical protein
MHPVREMQIRRRSYRRPLFGDQYESRDDKKLFQEWVGNRVLKRWPEVTKEELHGIKVRH